MPTNDELLNPRLTGAEYYARVNALDQKEALLSVWAALFTDNCSEYDEGDLYCRYATFVSLFQGRPATATRQEFRAFVGKNSPMGLHDGEDTDMLIYHQAAAHRYCYPGQA